MSPIAFIVLAPLVAACGILALATISEFFVLMFELWQEKRKKVAFEQRVKRGIIK
jgi:hypothetical protein